MGSAAGTWVFSPSDGIGVADIAQTAKTFLRDRVSQRHIKPEPCFESLKSGYRRSILFFFQGLYKRIKMKLNLGWGNVLVDSNEIAPR